MKSILEALSHIGIHHVKMMPISRVNEYPKIYNDRASKGQLSGLEPNYQNLDELRAYLQGYETIIGFAVPYALLPSEREARDGEISRVSIMAWDWDYHAVIHKSIEGALENVTKYKLHVDSGPLPERSIALQMGLARRGRSQMLLHETYGSAFYLGFLLIPQVMTEADIETHIKVDNNFNATLLADACLNCRKCQDHCPSGAIFGESDFDGKRCISALTQKKGQLTVSERASIGFQLYGCDHCQLACPANSPLFKASQNRLEPILISKSNNALSPEILLTLSQKAFKEKYLGKGFTWRGVKVSKRNALINMANSKDEIWVPIIETFIESMEKSQNIDDDLYETAIWALDVLRRA